MGTRCFRYQSIVKLLSCVLILQMEQSPWLLCGVFVVTDVSSDPQSFSFFSRLLVRGRIALRISHEFGRSGIHLQPADESRGRRKTVESGSTAKKTIIQYPPKMIIPTRQITGLFSPFPDLANQSVTRTDAHQRRQHQQEPPPIGPPTMTHT